MKESTLADKKLNKQNEMETENPQTRTPSKRKLQIFSADPLKAMSEKFFLGYTLVWMTVVSLLMILDLSQVLDDVSMLSIAVSITLPLFVIPAIFKSKFTGEKKWHDTYWFKANLFIAIFSCFAAYFGTEYFFDVLGMTYNYPQLSWTFDSALVGTGTNPVYIIMYFYTIVYFMTYHSAANLLLRPIHTASNRRIRCLFPIAVFGISYLFAWLETVSMTNPSMANTYMFEDVQRMIQYGSIFYACYFVVSFSVFFFIDENPAKPWSVKKVVISAFATCMGTMLLLDILTKFIGHI